jgi:hypothetical protein
VLPLPLYIGMTLAVFQEAGGAVFMALSFRKVARLPTPADPRNLSNYGGSRLFPRLLVALYWYCSTSYSSSLLMYSVAGSTNGLYVS